VTRRLAGPLAVLAAVPVLGGCRQDMHDQPRFEPFEATSTFADGRSARSRVPGTVARGELQLDPLLTQGKTAAGPSEVFPFAVTAEVLARGRERYDVFCAACHDRAGYGEGIVVARGMKQPPSLHVERLRSAAPGYVFDVVSNGFGAMYDLADRIPPADRWAIVAYVRALQLSQNARLEDADGDARRALEAAR
jgi:mono/diheme cytochrome c family protein